MKRKVLKSTAFAAVIVLTLFSLVACGGGIPDGKYEPTGDITTVEAITVKGNNFTLITMGIAQTFKYKFTEGTLTLTDGSSSVSVACTYNNEVINYGGIEFKKVS
jgi:hypothetical protein